MSNRRRASPRKLLIAFVKAALSLAFIAYILVHIDRSLLLADWNKLHSMSLVVILCLVALQTSVIASLRLKLICRGFALRLPLSSVWQVAISGSFVEQVALGFLGGDATRLLVLHQKNVPMKLAFTTVMLDRILGLLALAIVAAAGLSSVTGLLPGTDQQRVIVVVGIAVALAGAVALLAGRFSLIVRHFGEVVALIAGAFSTSVSRVQIFLVFSLALLTHVISVLAFYLIGHDLNLPLTFWQWFLIVPTALLLAAIPVTAGGWGLREAILIAALAPFRVPAETAVIPSVIFGVSCLLATLPGSIAFLISRAAFSARDSTGATGQTKGGIARDGLVAPTHGSPDLLGDAACD